MQKNKGTLADAGPRFNTRPVTATMLALHIKKEWFSRNPDCPRELGENIRHS